MDWDEAIEEAKDELGHLPEEYIEDWNEVVDLAKEILENEAEELRFESIENHGEYLQSPSWLRLRREILVRDNHRCRDCGNKARDVHHLDYDYLETEKEKEYCVSLCRDCHKSKHDGWD